jgi:hypothetical protein
MKTPTITVYLRCTENDVENDYEGGRIVLKPVRGQMIRGLIDGAVVLSMDSDAFLRQFPVTRDEKQQRAYRVTIEEIEMADLPPDPDAKPAPAAAAAGVIQPAT